MSTLWLILIALAVAWGLAYFRSPLWLWFAAVAAALAACTYTGRLADPWLIAAWSAYGMAAALLLLPPLRRLLISNPVLKIFRHIMPAMSQTEREALEAGTVWWEAELFSGAPRWRKLVAVPPPSLSAEEQAFLDGPVEELCAMLNDWQITHELHDLPPEVWRFIKARGFFGMIIPKRYGGLEFSAQAHSAVVTKIGSRSITAAVTVMVPNSLGPAELLIRYGSDAQKNHYLPRLAKGEEVPCFALTSPDAGSDAAAMPDRAFVCRGQHNGREVLGMRVTWEKRYITLGPVATVLGLAFRLFDPERLLGGDEEAAGAPSLARGPRLDPSGDVGITLALIPAKHPGVRIGTRHNPLDIPFQNGPNSGDDVFIPMDFVIGGAERVGQGWRMLMDCLAAGRSISLPALSCGAGQLTTRAIGAYARVRKQFKLPIGKFEGVEEALARIGGYTYIMDAARTLTARALDLGEQPAVASAIVKYHLTELMRRVVNDGMDVQGGAGICLGPQNLLGRAYQALPISITVEGANILTRTLIIYGQGATRCHPWVRAEMEAVADSDDRRARKNFDRALFGHMGFTISNALRALWLGVTGARLVRTPFAGPAHRHAQKLTRLSTAFALLSDAALLTLGGALKRKEKLSGRLADALSYLYLASAVIKRFEDDGRPADDRPLLDWACHYCLNQTEKALVVILKNFPSRFLDWLLGGLIFPAGRRYYPPTDRDGHAVASLLLSPSATRDRLTAGIFQPRGENEQLGRLELALAAAIEAEPHERKLHRFLDGHPLLLGDLDAQIREATRVGVLTADEGAKVRRAHERRAAAVRVDDFSPENF